MMNAHIADTLRTIGNVPTLPTSAVRSGTLRVPRIIALTFFVLFTSMTWLSGEVFAYKAIAAGRNHTVALKDTGAVLAWGYNGYGQTTVPTAAQSGVIAIAAGDYHTVALKDTGAVLAWGHNGQGQTTVPPGAQSGVIAIAAGAYHTVALKDTGEVLAWGENNEGQTTVPAAAQSGVIAIAAGGYHTVALKDTGQVLAWGYNDDGQTTVPPGAQSGVIAIAAGEYHTVALKDTGEVLAWGENSEGQTTVPVESQFGVIAIAAGSYYTVALKDTGEVLAWGWNGYGQTTVPPGAQSGVIAIAADSYHTVALKDTGEVLAWGYNGDGQTTVPVDDSKLGVIATAAGAYHTVALTSYGEVLAWGYNVDGRATVPAPAQSGVIAIAAGGYHTVALKDTGEVLAWGYNGDGQTTVPAAAQSGVIAIAAGFEHTVALKDTGEVLAWGAGTTNTGSSPEFGQSIVPVAAQSGVIAIAAGAYHTVALKDTGEVLAWGWNDYGQTTVPAAAQSGVIAIAAGGFHTVALKDTGEVLSWGSQTTVPAPAQSGVKAIAAGWGHTLALKDTGAVVAWGDNTYGQTTVPAAAQSGVIAIAAGGEHTVAVASDGEVLAWGAGDAARTTDPPVYPHYGQSIVPGGTALITLNTSLNPSVYGDSVTFTAQVVSTGDPHAPKGSVTFKDNGTVMGTAMLNGSGVAVFSTSALTGGNHTIVAVYNGDAIFASTSDTVTQTVNKAATATSLSAAPPATSVYGTSVAFTATVTPPATGTVIFRDGGTTIGNVTMVGSTATLFMNTLAAGNHSITAEYSGDINFNGSSSSALPHNITKAGSTTAVLSSQNPSVYHDPVTFTATVSSTTSGIPSGTVTFKDGSTTLAGNVTLNASGVAAFTTSALPGSALTGGSHSITVEYGGDANFTASTSSSLTQIVNPAATTTSLPASLPATNYGALVTFTATVGSATTGTLTGNVTFKEGSTVLGTVALSGGTASYSTTALGGSATHLITAYYNGDVNFALSNSSPCSVLVNPAVTAASVVSDYNPSAFHVSVKFTATVANLSTAPTVTPNGSVTFKDGSTTLGAVALSGGTASYETAVLALGLHSITVEYGGNVNFTASASPALSQRVTNAATTTSIATSLNPSVYGDPVTFSAVVSSSAGTPIGSMTFKDGSAELGTVPLTNGSAQMSTSALTGGIHKITALYNGDVDFAMSNSPQLTQTVNQATTALDLRSSSDTTTYGNPVTFTATVTPSAATGTMTFKDNGVDLGTATISGGVATYSTAALAGGVHGSITAVYAGDINYMTSTSNTISQTVNKASTATTVTSSILLPIIGDSVTFTATVANLSSGVTPVGSVTFKDGTTSLGTVALSGGTAQYSTTSLASGSHPITVEYSGNANFTVSSSSALSQTVRIADGSFYGGGVDMTDALKSLRIAAGLDTPSGSDMDHGDVAPLLNGRPRPDNKIDINDVVAILRKAVGLSSF